MALVSHYLIGADGLGEARFTLAPGIDAEPIDDRPSLRLRAGRRVVAEVIPLGLPTTPGTTPAGSLAVDDREIVLRQACVAHQVWMPLLISWDPDRNRRKPHWRSLTVTEQSRVCRPQEAVAARIAWGRGPSLVFYRALKPAGPRAFLGCQTRATCFIGLFDEEGEVRPIISLA
jgi:hypothetical protein